MSSGISISLLTFHGFRAYYFRVMPKPANRTDDVITTALLVHYVIGEFQFRAAPEVSAFLGPQSRKEMSDGPVGALSALFGLPPNADVMLRDFFLIAAARCMTDRDPSWTEATALRAGIAAFRKSRLKPWQRFLQKHGTMPGPIPIGERTRWLKDALVKSRLCSPSSDDLANEWKVQPDIKLRFFSKQFSALERLYLAFANCEKMPTSTQRLYEIISRDFSGVAGDLAFAIYDEVTR